MTVGELEPYLREHWPTTREQLLAGSYRPCAVKRQLIPKSGGGMRELGIPTALDRFVQQLLLQVLQPMFDPTFSEHSHGFRPGRGEARTGAAVIPWTRLHEVGWSAVLEESAEGLDSRVGVLPPGGVRGVGLAAAPVVLAKPAFNSPAR